MPQYVLHLIVKDSAQLVRAGFLVVLVVLVGLSLSAPALAQDLPVPLRLADVVRIATQQRSEITAMGARASAAAQRPAIVGALEDPMISQSIDHYPLKMMEDTQARGRFNWTISVEQRFPLSDIRRQRSLGAQASAQRAEADVDRVRLEVALEAQLAFFMLVERRAMPGILDEQLNLARELVATASARYAAARGPQAEVLRAEVEVARAQAAKLRLVAETSAAEAMLNASLGRPSSAVVPATEHQERPEAPPAAENVRTAALSARPELRAGVAEIDRSAAEIQVMRAMYGPMASVRVGRSSTMAEGPGAMIMFGISIPIWRDRLQAGVAEAQAMESMARADLEAMRRMIEGEASVAREIVNAERTRVESLRQEVVPRARMAAEASLAAYSSGRSTLVSVIESTRALWDVRIELIMANTALASSWARLNRAMANNETAPR